MVAEGLDVPKRQIVSDDLVKGEFGVELWEKRSETVVLELGVYGVAGCADLDSGEVVDLIDGYLTQ
jgi:hypothetical protein